MAAVSDARFRGKESSPDRREETRAGAGARAALEILVVANAVAFLVASVIHFGVRIPLGFTTLDDATILPAAIAEAVIGVAFVLAALEVFARRRAAWSATLGAHLFGVVGVLVGLGVTLNDSGDSSPTNLLFHELILPVLVVGLLLLLTRSGQAALGRPMNRKEGGA